MSELAGISVLVTRPEPQTTALAENIDRLSGTAIACPTIAIVKQQLRPTLWPAEERVAASLFTSKAAVAFGVDAWRAHYPSAHVVCAVGPGTAAALEGHGVKNIVKPTADYTSEGVLALDEMAAARIAGRVVLLIKGVGGRELLPQTLRERGATVFPIECYARHKTTDSISVALNNAGVRCPDYAVVSSAEALVNLAEKLETENEQACFGTQLLVSSARIAAQAAPLGFTRDPQVIDNPTNENFVRRIIAMSSETS